MTGPFETIGPAPDSPDGAPLCDDGFCAVPAAPTLAIDPDAAEPPFEQVRRQVATFAHDGTWEAGHRLPTVRALADQLGLAVNTVAKAYKALEADGVVETRGRGGTLVAPRTSGGPGTEAAATDLVRAARRHGLTRAETHLLVDRSWDA